MISPGHKNVSHKGGFGFTNPTIFWLMYSTYLRVNILWSCMGCMVMVCAVCESCETALQRIFEPYFVLTGYPTKYQMILNLIPSERRDSVLSYCLIFFPKLHKIDLEITVSKRAVFKTRLSQNLFSRPSARREGFVKTLTTWKLAKCYLTLQQLMHAA